MGVRMRLFNRVPEAPSLPEIRLAGGRISVSHQPAALGEKHSRLWIQHLRGAIALLEEEIGRGMGDLGEKQAQIADKMREIRMHEAMYPDDARDDEYRR